MNTLHVRLLLATAAAAWVGCSPVDDGGNVASGGAPAGGGTPGVSQGGAASASGGQPSSGGSAGALVTGGSGGATGGSSGTPSAGGASAGTGNAGATAGGSAGSSATGGAGTGGSGASAGASGGSAGSSGAAGRGGSGGGGGGGGTSGAAGGGASAGGTGKACGSPDLLLCEDFESTADGAIPMGWTRQGAAAVASDQKRGGMRSLKVSPAPNGARRISHSAATFGTAFWGRVYYRVQTPVPDAFVHSTFVELSGTRPSVGGTAAYRVVDTVKDAGANAKHQFLFNIQPSGNEFGVGSSYDWTFDAMWHCAEWQIDNANQSYSFFIDGAEVPSIRVLNGRAVSGNGSGEVPTAFTQLHVGLNNYQSAPPGFTVWIDDVAISKARVGCVM